jgi:hypothetical protein
MLKKLSAFIICFGLSLGAVALLQIRESHRTLFEDAQKPCNYSESKTTLSQKHYYPAKQVQGLLGKKVKNLKCGKIKCAIGLGNCENVQIGEVGTIKGLQPRFGADDFLLVVEWERSGNQRAALAEQNPDKLLSYVGNDNSFEFIK